MHFVFCTFVFFLRVLAFVEANMYAYILKASDVAGFAFLAKKIGGKFGLKMA